MYKLLEIKESMMTREILLENVDTKIKNWCFDDSELKSNNNFHFMEIGEVYDCKILLFGSSVENPEEETFECELIEEVSIGNKRLTKVKINKDIYYIDVVNLHSKKIYYKVTRKDIIQVDSIIHHDLLV